MLARLPTNAAIQAALASKTLKNADSLPEMRALLAKYTAVKDNLDFLRAIHVTGSKGKGSVCAFTESLLRAAGCRTGMFTSPHLVHPRERIRINGAPVSESTFAQHVLRLDEMLQAAGEPVSFFRFMWLVAVDIFYEAKVDVGIVEVGMGGRFDATNVIDHPVVCGITSLAMEHVGILGPTLRDIAWNKAGIMKPNVPVFTVRQTDPVVMRVFQEEAAQLQGVALSIAESIDALAHWTLGIAGDHQRDNAALAIALTSSWMRQCRPEWSKPSHEHLRTALATARWPGRHQIARLSPTLTLFLDGAHTFESISYATRWFQTQSTEGVRKTLLFHCSVDRDFERLLAPLIASCSVFSQAVFLIPDSLAPGRDDRNLLTSHHQQLARFWQERTGQPAMVCDRFDAVPLDCSVANEVLVCGSLYLVGSVMKTCNIET